MSPVGVVTGGGRGIGAAVATLLAERGWDVAVGYREDAGAAGAVVERCRSLGRQAVSIAADVASELDVVRLFATVDETLGRLDGLVNSAGIVAPASRVDDLRGGRIERILAVNVMGPLLCAREAIRRMSPRHGGSGGVIVNLSSAASRLGSPGEYVDYAASKGAVDTMTVGLAKEVADEGIRVNAVRPGLIATGIHASGGAPDRVERLRHHVPMGRGGEPHEVARAVAWLCSDEASYVTGALLDVSGGR
ncbi:MAG: SDR family oxidoreductase [Actinobacteria bacterium]|nr:SDR family oxidoreductase [Actinomycetota bacterium]